MIVYDIYNIYINIRNEFSTIEAITKQLDSAWDSKEKYRGSNE